MSSSVNEEGCVPGDGSEASKQSAREDSILQTFKFHGFKLYGGDNPWKAVSFSWDACLDETPEEVPDDHVADTVWFSLSLATSTIDILKTRWMSSMCIASTFAVLRWACVDVMYIFEAVLRW